MFEKLDMSKQTQFGNIALVRITHPGKGDSTDPHLAKVRELHDALVDYEMNILASCDIVQYNELIDDLKNPEFMDKRYVDFLEDLDLLTLIKINDSEDDSLRTIAGFIATKNNKVMGIYFRPEYRRDRLGAGLLQWFQQQFGYEEVVVSVYWPNQGAREFYQALGFEESSHQVVGEKPLFVDYIWRSLPRRQELADLELISKLYVDFSIDSVTLDDHYDIAELEAIVRQCKRNQRREQDRKRLEKKDMKHMALRLAFGAKVEEGTWIHEFNANVVKQVEPFEDTEVLLSAEIDGQLVGQVLFGPYPGADKRGPRHSHIQKLNFPRNCAHLNWLSKWLQMYVNAEQPESMSVIIPYMKGENQAAIDALKHFGFVYTVTTMDTSRPEGLQDRQHLEWTRPVEPAVGVRVHI